MLRGSYEETAHVEFSLYAERGRRWQEFQFASPTYPVAADFVLHRHSSCLCRRSGSQPSVDAPFQSLHHSYGTHCHLTFSHLHPILFSVNA